MRKLRVSENATDEEVQRALHQLFQSSPQGNTSSQGPQGHTVLMEYPQGTNVSTNDDSSPQGLATKCSIIAATGISKIQLDSELKNSLLSALQSEAPYSEILIELNGGARQVVKNHLIFKQMNSLLMVHDQNQDSDLDFWRIVVPDVEETKQHIVQELHSTPYNAHPGI